MRRLLAEAGAVELPESPAVDVQGIEVPADSRNMRSPETYVGLGRSLGFASLGSGAIDEAFVYGMPPDLRINEWGLAGNWTVSREAAVLDLPDGHIAYRFHARDLNLILAPPADGGTAGFRVRLDGEPPRSAHGLDIDDDGNGVIREPRMYQLIRQPGPISDRLFEIEILDPGAAALCFTFG